MSCEITVGDEPQVKPPKPVQKLCFGSVPRHKDMRLFDLKAF